MNSCSVWDFGDAHYGAETLMPQACKAQNLNPNEVARAEDLGPNRVVVGCRTQFAMEVGSGVMRGGVMTGTRLRN